MGLFSKKSQKRDDNLPARRRRNLNADQDRPRISATAFKSGRTLPGTTYARLRSTERTAVKTATPREKLHHLAYIRKRIAWVFAGFVVASAGLVFVLWQFTADVVVQPSTDSSIPQSSLADYEQSIQKYLSQNPIERLRFNLNESTLKEDIVAAHPEIESIKQLDSAGFTKTKFVISFRKPVVSWQVESTKYFVDSQGISFVKNVYENPSVTIVDNSGVRYTPGTAIASARFLSFVGRVVSLLQNRGLTVERVLIPAGTSRQVEINVADATYPFILSIDRSPGDQAEDVERVINYFKSIGTVPKYADIRVKGKAFYRE